MVSPEMDTKSAQDVQAVPSKTFESHAMLAYPGANGAPLGVGVDAGDSSWLSRMSGAPWWMVSLALHILLITLAGLVSMAIQLPKGDDSVVMITELQPQLAADREKLEKKPELQDVLASNRDTPPTDPTSKQASDIVVPPDILAKAEMGDHFETINPDRPDTHSAYGVEDARSFHSLSGNADKAGGGGMGGVGMDDVVGVGGAASAGTGGGFGGGNGAGIGVGDGSGKGSFGNRNGGGRRLMVMRHGGSRATESAVDRALEWLAYHQETDGHWDAVKYGAGKKCDTFSTGIALLAFLGAGHTEKVGHWKENVQKAIAWLKSKQNDDGRILDKHDDIGYQVAVATMAMSEAAAMANIKETRDSAQKAVNYCIDKHQNGEGSEKHAWRYSAKSATEDLSVSGWFIMALKSAKVAGLHVDPASFEGAAHFLDKVQQAVPGADTSYGPVVSYGYTGPGSGPRTCAIGNLCRQFMGAKMEEVQGSIDYFVTKYGVPGQQKHGADRVDLYYYYYGTLCAFQQGGDIWKKWNEALKTELVPTQCKDGDNAGSWNPEGAHSNHWGRVGQTAMSALCLEVYYRFAKLQADH